MRAVPADSWRLLPDDQRPVILPGAALLPAIPGRGSVDVRFTAGFAATWDGVPADLAQAVLMLAAHYYEDRGSSHSARGTAVRGQRADRALARRAPLAGRGGRA